ncbi:radical SAM protein [Pseudodesulfovibrio methanolicus]|uniref:Radical SAM protein n=1 Tax=Pseudodesulfovibrio methanolicus TaxID=3126690 RepID=A0ABZ2IXB7_9BACT
MKRYEAERQFEALVERFVSQAVYCREPGEESPYFPAQVHIEPTNSCNLRCTHCHHYRDEHGRNKYTRKLGLMDVDLFRKILDEIGPLGCSVTLNVQGEPLLHPRIVEMVRIAKGHGIYLSLLTNATRLTRELTTRFLDAGLDRMVFSFDACTKDVYESVRINSKFEPTIANILDFLNENELRGHPTHVCVSGVQQSRTMPHTEEYRTYFGKLPVDKIFLNPMLNLCGVSGTADEIDMARYMDIAPQDRPVCRISWENLVVNWDGLVSPCPVDVNVLAPVGDANTERLQDIWNGERMREFRRAHLTRDYSAIEKNGPVCSACNCLFDEEYDLFKFQGYAVKAIARAAIHHAHHLAQGAAEAGADDEARAAFLRSEREKYPREDPA